MKRVEKKLSALFGSDLFSSKVPKSENSQDFFEQLSVLIEHLVVLKNLSELES